MPTLADFQTAALRLRTAAEGVRALAVSAENARVDDVIMGGTLGREVPARITWCVDVANGCASDLDATAQICDRRAAVIAAYEADVAIYELQLEQYAADLAAHEAAVIGAYMIGGVHTGWPPVEPVPPPPPPAWAEVRRF